MANVRASYTPESAQQLAMQIQAQLEAERLAVFDDMMNGPPQYAPDLKCLQPGQIVRFKTFVGVASPLPKRRAPPAPPPPAPLVDWPAKRIEDGDRTIDHICFWMEFGPVGRWIASRLADQLDAISSNLEQQ